MIDVSFSAQEMIKRGVIYSLMVCAVLGVGGFIIAYGYCRDHCPRQPEVKTEHIYPMRMKQPFDVYLTGFEKFWVEYGMVAGWIPGMIGAFLNQRWQIVKNYPPPKKMY